MKSKITIATMSLLTLALAGCMEVHEKVANTTEVVVTGHPGGAYEPKNTTRYALENTQPFVLMDKSVEQDVTCPGIEKRTLADGRLEIIANIRNRSGRRQEFQVSCVFKDEQGFSTGDETPWESLILTERAQESVRFIAMNDKAKNFTIRVRQPH